MEAQVFMLHGRHDHQFVISEGQKEEHIGEDIQGRDDQSVHVEDWNYWGMRPGMTFVNHCHTQLDSPSYTKNNTVGRALMGYPGILLFASAREHCPSSSTKPKPFSAPLLLYRKPMPRLCRKKLPLQPTAVSGATHPLRRLTSHCLQARKSGGLG